jgi:hypothetical protein
MDEAAFAGFDFKTSVRTEGQSVPWNSGSKADEIH